MTAYCLPKEKLSETKFPGGNFRVFWLEGMKLLNKREPKKRQQFFEAFDSLVVLLITIFDKISWVTHDTHEVGHQVRTGWEKKETATQLHLSRFLTEWWFNFHSEQVAWVCSFQLPPVLESCWDTNDVLANLWLLGFWEFWIQQHLVCQKIQRIS